MNEDRLNTLRQQDANLRDAIRQDEMERPQMPADLNAQLMKRVGGQSRTSHVRKHWPWLAAACVAAFIVVFVTPPKATTGDGMDGQHATAKIEKPQEVKPVETEVETPKVEEPRKADVPKTEPVKVKSRKLRQRPVATENLLAQQTAPAEAAQPAAHEAEHAKTAAHEQELAQTAAPKAEPKMTTLTERDIPITRPENYKYTPEEIALLKKQANEAYLKWAELELEISKYNLEQASSK